MSVSNGDAKNYILVGESLFFIILGILFLAQYYNFMATAIPVTGVVTHVSRYSEDDKVDVIYIVDGVEYTTSFNTTYSSKAEGDEVSFIANQIIPLK